MNNKSFKNYNNIFSFWYDSIRYNGVANVIKKFIKYLKRYLFVTKLIRYATAVIAFIETSAAMLVGFSFLIIAIPIIFSVLVIISILNIFQYKKYNKILKDKIEKSEKIVIVYAKKGYYDNPEKYFNYMVKDFAENGSLTFVITQSYIHDRFYTAKEINENLWLIRLNYYFVLKKSSIKNLSSKVTYIS